MTLDDIAAAPRLSREAVVVRYVGGSHLDPGTGQINGSAFERTVGDTDGVSFTRRGLLAAGDEDDREAIRTVMASRLRLGRTAVFAELYVGAALDALVEFEQDVFFVENPQPDKPPELANPAHALLMGFPFKGEQVGSLKSEVAGDRMRSCIHGRFDAVARAETASA